VERDRNAVWKDGDYNPDQLRPVDECADARDRRSKDNRCITIRDLLEKKGAEAMERSASLLSRGASRAASSRIG
jgi:hypothetical protein